MAQRRRGWPASTLTDEVHEARQHRDQQPDCPMGCRGDKPFAMHMDSRHTCTAPNQSSPPPPAAHPVCPSPDLRLPPPVHQLDPRQPAQRTALTRDSACKVPRVPSGVMAACTVAGESQGGLARAGAARARQLLPPPAANPSLHGAVGPREVSGRQSILHKRAGWA